MLKSCQENRTAKEESEVLKEMYKMFGAHENTTLVVGSKTEKIWLNLHLWMWYCIVVEAFYKKWKTYRNGQARKISICSPFTFLVHENAHQPPAALYPPPRFRTIHSSLPPCAISRHSPPLSARLPHLRAHFLYGRLTQFQSALRVVKCTNKSWSIAKSNRCHRCIHNGLTQSAHFIVRKVT